MGRGGMVAQAIRPPAAQTPLAISMARLNPGPSWPLVVLIPASSGRIATARSPAMRATALLVPDASPARSWLSEARTAAVSGATVTDRPRPNTATAGGTARGGAPPPGGAGPHARPGPGPAGAAA